MVERPNRPLALKPCYLWPAGYQVRLIGSGAAPADLLATRLIEGLLPVVEPLLLGAEFSCGHLTGPRTESTATPPTFWTLYRDVVPSYVRLPEYSAVDRADAVPAITPDRAKDWLAQGLDQPCPGERSWNGLRRLEMFSVRARLLSPYSAGVFRLLSHPAGPEAASIPVEDDQDGRWLYAPVKDSVFAPPVSYQVSTRYGETAATIAVHWSWWFEPGSAEFDTLRRALLQVVDAGWRFEPPAATAGYDPFGLSESSAGRPAMPDDAERVRARRKRVGRSSRARSRHRPRSSRT